MESRFRKTVRKDGNIHNAYLLVHSEKQGIHLNMAEGSTSSRPAHPEQPYHIASVGKLFTSVLISLLVEQDKLNYEDFIASYLDDDLLKGLHVYKETDYTQDIKVKHLLNHTSGLHDFFDDKPKQGKTMMDLVFATVSFLEARRSDSMVKRTFEITFSFGRRVSLFGYELYVVRFND